MKITLFVAMSINGLAARRSGEEDFLSDENWQSLIELGEAANCLIVGRKTYEVVREWKDYNFDFFDQAVKIVVSGQADFELDEGYILASSPAEAIAKAQELGHQEAVLVGGPHTSTSFAKAKLIDEMIVNIEPVVVGSGLNIFARDEELEAKWELASGARVKGNLIQLKYIAKK